MKSVPIRDSGLRGTHVKMEFLARTLLGEIRGVYLDYPKGVGKLVVHHFNGDRWPVDPEIGAVEFLERTFQNPEED